jgi:hypothetical protein
VRCPKYPFSFFSYFPFFFYFSFSFSFFFNFSSPSIHHRTPSGLSIRIAPARATSHPSPHTPSHLPLPAIPSPPASATSHRPWLPSRRHRDPPGFPRVAIELPGGHGGGPGGAHRPSMEATGTELVGWPPPSSSGRLRGEDVLAHPLAQLRPKQLPKLLEKLCQTDPNGNVESAAPSDLLPVATSRMSTPNVVGSITRRW